MEPGSSHVMNPCAFCLELVQATSSSDEGGLCYDFKRAIGSSCNFCEQLKQRYFASISSEQGLCEPVWALELYSSESLMHDEDNLRYQITIRGENTRLEFAVWADEGTSACKRFVKRPPVIGPNADAAHGLARDWLAECISFHKTCVSTKTGTLPTRVLQIFGEIKTSGVRLIETGGITEARYCALSHCWGPVDKQPLRTTLASYSGHLRGIGNELLPKTFREAIELTRSLNIEYLWIDSLCIIQDDTEDWRCEAGRMADVYRNATLVISASDAKDSTDGLFIAERKPEIITTAPYIAEGRVQGRFNIVPLPSPRRGLGQSHLNTRAWAFQERLLSRRIILFARGGISWKCNEFETWERGSHCDLGFNESISWLALLDEYSKRKLTNVGDRLYALKGVVEDMRITREDSYLESYGVWHSDLFQQILWRQDEPLLEAEVLELPTWTWAAIGGAKVWSFRYGSDGATVIMPRVLHIRSSGALLSSGHITKSLLTLRSIVFREWEWSSRWYEMLEIIMLPAGWNGNDYPAHLIQSPTAISGIAVFDRSPSNTAVCFFVARQDRYERLYGANISSDSRRYTQKDDDITRELAQDQESQTVVNGDISNSECTNEIRTRADEAAGPDSTLISTIKQQTEAQSAIVACDTILNDESNSDERDNETIARNESSENQINRDEANNYKMFAEDGAPLNEIEKLARTTKFVYWCLLLEPAGEGKFTRVGLAMLYPDAFQALGAEFTEFEII